MKSLLAACSVLLQTAAPPGSATFIKRHCRVHVRKTLFSVFYRKQTWLPCSQQSDTGLYNDPDEGSPYPVHNSQTLDPIMTLMKAAHTNTTNGSSARNRVMNSIFSLQFCLPCAADFHFCMWYRETASFCTLSAHLVRGHLTGLFPPKPPHKISL